MDKFLFRAFRILTFSLLITLLIFTQVFSQPTIELFIDGVINDNFPEIEMFVSVSDGQNYPISGLTSANYSISEAGSVVSGIDVIPVYEKGLSIVLLVDQSNTMGFGEPTGMQVVVQVIKGYLSSLASDDQVALVSFSDIVSIVQGLTTDKNLVSAGLDTLIPQESAALYDGLMDALDILRNMSGRKLILLLTDGPESGLSEYTFEQVIDEAARQNTFIYPIGWRGADHNELGKLAELTRGVYQGFRVDQPDIADFEGALNSLSDVLSKLREQYQIHYVSGLPADGNEYEFVVKLDHLGAYAEQTGHFTTRPGEVIVDLLELESGQVTGGKVRFIPNVSSPADLAEVQLFIDGQQLTNLISEPYEYMWDSTTVTPGVHEFLIRAIDSAGNMGEKAISLTIELPIKIAITNPLDGGTVNGPSSISAEISALSQIANVEFFVDDNLLSTLQAQPYEIQWDLTDIPAGSHEIKVVAHDDQGYSASDEIRVNVALQERSGMVLIAVLVVIAAAAILVPLGLRTRRKYTQKEKIQVTPGLAGHDARGAILQELEGLQPDRIWPLAADETRLGRKKEENDVPLKSTKASRQHAVIRLHQNQHVIYSLNAENPVIINDQAVDQQVLQDGDIIKAGETVLRYEVGRKEG
jgi:hypothetical protein